MEKFSDIFKNVKDRFTNPLIFSFICSWIFINWKITVALIWYDPKQITNTGCNSIFEFIEDELRRHATLWPAFWFAIVYTLALPIIKNIVKAFYSWAYKWGDTWNLNILKGGSISVDRYLKLREDHENTVNILQDVIKKESEYQDRFHNSANELFTAQNALNELRGQLTEKEIILNKYRDVSFIGGAWINKYYTKEHEKGEENILIEGGTYYIMSEFGVKQHVFNITDYYYDEKNKNIFFIKELTEEQKKARPFSEHISINRLKIENSAELIGTENYTTKIHYTRKH